MNTENLIKFFQKKVVDIDNLSNFNQDSAEFKKWRETILATCRRMGGSYFDRFNSVRYNPTVLKVGGDNSHRFTQAYNKGLLDAKVLLEVFVEELETWGYDDAFEVEKSKTARNQQPAVNVNVTQNQTQSQSISGLINLSAYDEKTQEELKKLAEEIRKPNNRSKVIPIVRWLAEKGVDALIALLPSMIKFE